MALSRPSVLSRFVAPSYRFAHDLNRYRTLPEFSLEGKVAVGKHYLFRPLRIFPLTPYSDRVSSATERFLTYSIDDARRASQGLGQQILAAFALSGAHGAVVDLKQSSAEESIKTIQKEVKDAGLPEAKMHGYECDTSSEEVVKSTWEKIVKDFGKVDILVTNAGIVR